MAISSCGLSNTCDFLVVVVVRPTLGLILERSGGPVTLIWAGSGKLQESENPTGPWRDVSGATSPYIPGGPSGAAKFYRLLSDR